MVICQIENSLKKLGRRLWESRQAYLFLFLRVTQIVDSKNIEELVATLFNLCFNRRRFAN